MLGSQEKILEPKVNVKFFTVDPYTPCNRVSRPFPIWYSVKNTGHFSRLNRPNDAFFHGFSIFHTLPSCGGVWKIIKS